MTPTLLTIRVNRRAIAAAQLTDESLTFATGCHLSSRSERAIAAAIRFLEHSVDALRPSLVALDAPQRPAGSISDLIIKSIEEFAASRGLQVVPVAKPLMLAAYGLVGLRNRQELRQLVEQFWPELGFVKGQVQPFVVDAAAAALYAETRLQLERVVG